MSVRSLCFFIKFLWYMNLKLHQRIDISWVVEPFCYIHMKLHWWKDASWNVIDQWTKMVLNLTGLLCLFSTIPSGIAVLYFSPLHPGYFENHSTLYGDSLNNISKSFWLKKISSMWLSLSILCCRENINMLFLSSLENAVDDFACCLVSTLNNFDLILDFAC